MNTVLFDLDGTLLPMDLKEFNDTYFKSIAGRFTQIGLSPEYVKRAILNSIEEVYNNDGFLTHEELFWRAFAKWISQTGEPINDTDLRFFKKEFDKFYKNDFFVARLNTKPSPIAKECVKILKSKGYRLVVCASPVFPENAIYQMIEWADFKVEDFEYITTMENCCFSKPNLNYYRRVLQTLKCTSDECMMVGNDVDEDMSAIKLGIDTFLIDDCLINKNNLDITDFKTGSFKAFREFVKELPSII